MPGTADDATREELRRAGLPADGPLPRLLMLLRTAEETHIDPAEAQRLAAEGGLPLAQAELVNMLDTLVAHGLLGRLPTMGATPVYDTISRLHSHMLDDATSSIVDLDVSPETLSAIIRQAIADQPGRVEVLLRIRAPLAREDASPRPARGPGRPRAAPAR
jgi:Fur family iron response transcriptional regulator